MQRANCTVRLAGSGDNTVAKTNVSPAEIACLLAIHGEGSVVDIQPTSMDKTPHVDERTRLKFIYGKPVIDRLFPGDFSKLPVTIAELGIGEADEDLKTEGDDEDDEPVVVIVEEDEDDKLLRDSVMIAPSKQALRDIAKENDVDLNDVADKMDTLRSVLLTRLFPAKG